MLPMRRFLAGPNADPFAVLHGPAIHGRHNVAAATAVVTQGTMLSPGTGTGATVKSKVNVILPVGFLNKHFEPVRPNLSNLITSTFFLNIFGVSYFACH